MNEIIKELANQCGFRSNPDAYDRNQSFDIPKFAELIVRECIGIVKQKWIMPDENVIAEEIKDHFGVKE
jgi:hypothetical protein